MGLISRVLVLYSIGVVAALSTLSTISIWVTPKLWRGPYYSSSLCQRLHPLKFPYKLSCGIGIVRIFNPALSRIFSTLLIGNHIWLDYLIQILATHSHWWCATNIATYLVGGRWDRYFLLLFIIWGPRYLIMGNGCLA